MLIRHTTQYMISAALTAMLGFISAAVFTRLLTPADYGVYVVGFGLASFIGAVAFTWGRYSVMRFESEGGGADVRMTSLTAYAISASTAPVLLLAARYIGHMSWDRAAHGDRPRARRQSVRTRAGNSALALAGQGVRDRLGAALGGRAGCLRHHCGAWRRRARATGRRRLRLFRDRLSSARGRSGAGRARRWIPPS